MKANWSNHNLALLLLRLCVATILIIHGVAGMFNGGLTGFGQYLNGVGFGYFGLPLAWMIKLSHVVAAITLLLARWQFWPGLLTVFILVTGIFLVHLPSGWFVVGGGFNGVEFNLLLIVALLVLIFPKNELKIRL
jgi:putative oxidoreductase